MLRERIGIMGGTFDPIHYGHLFAAEEARVAFSLDRVLFVPTGNPPHKSYAGMADADARYEMTLLAVSENPFFEVTRMETDRAGVSYTRDTLRSLRERCPEADFFLILGTDAASDLPGWKSPDEILSLCTIVVVDRPGYGRDRIALLPEAIRSSILRLDTTLLDISATDIRTRVAMGRSVAYLLPDSVGRYIRKQNLYARSDGESD